MEKLSTTDKLIQLLYNEISATDEMMISSELSQNDALAQEYEMLRDAKNSLPKVLFNPSDSVVDRILAYSRTTAHEPHL
jgi:hypothetical protein